MKYVAYLNLEFLIQVLNGESEMNMAHILLELDHFLLYRLIAKIASYK